MGGGGGSGGGRVRREEWIGAREAVEGRESEGNLFGAEKKRKRKKKRTCGGNSAEKLKAPIETR